MNTLKVLVAFSALAVTLQLAAAGTNYTVGAPSGKWDLSTDYTQWVSDKTFHPGDNLIFTYTSSHDVWEVSKSEYDSCTKGTPIKQYKSGNDVIALTAPGTRYFYCSVSGHCSSGMKLAVSVVDSTNSSSPPPPSTAASAPPPPTGAAALADVGIHSVVALAFGAMLMIFA